MEDIAQANIEVVLPNVAMAKQAMAQFEQIKTEILNNDTDIIMIEGKKYIKRSGWRKIALAFNVTTEIVKIEREKIDDVYIVRVIARAIAPNGRISEEVGICDSTEFQKGRLKFSYHNIETKATTRAINRSISNLVGGGELSAEEIIEGPEEKIEEKSEPKTYQNLEKNKKEIFIKADKIISDFIDVHGLKIGYTINWDIPEARIDYINDSKVFSDLERNLNRIGIEKVGIENGESIWRLKNGK